MDQAAAPPVPGDTGDDELRAALDALSKLAVGQLQLRDTLAKVAEYAVAAIPGADGAGLTLLGTDRADSVVATAAFVRDLDAMQHRVGEGPCITAATEGRTVRSGALCSDRQWPRFGPRAGRLDVRSALSLPLATDEGVLGAMAVYAHAADAFDDRSARIAELFAVPAAVAVQTAQVLDRANRLATQLQTALTHRAVIDQAKGILISRTGCDPDEAFDRLRQLSQSRDRKLHDIAQKVVEQAQQRARARQARPPA